MTRKISCELCVVGAGLAGMNALAAACEYLGPDDTVVLVDRRARNGGMWVDTYDYVRLHQPHPMFTAGNVPWQHDKPPWYLAAKPEVLDHFAHCLDVLRAKVNLVECFGHTYEAHEEVPARDGYRARIALRGPDGTPVTIDARRCIKAFGFRVPVNPPLALSSARVHSVSPEDPRLFSAEDADKPVIVVGGGKTGMDTAHALLARFPGREVHLAIGRGTAFMNRNVGFPRGLARWWRGQTTLATFTDIALRFDGTNERETFDYFKRRYAVYLGDRQAYYVLGLQSEEENDFLRRHLRSVRNGYVRDVVDDGDTPTLVYDDGHRQPLPPGSYVVNCTGYVMRDDHPYEPYLSPHGTVASVQPTSSIHILTSFGGYFLGHLLYLDKLATLPLYALDHQAMTHRNKEGLPFACMVHLLYNLFLIVDAVPPKVMQQCGLDFDRWFPLPRRLLGFLKLRGQRARLLAHCRAALDRYRARFDLQGGVLDTVAARSGTAAT